MVIAHYFQLKKVKEGKSNDKNEQQQKREGSETEIEQKWIH